MFDRGGRIRTCFVSTISVYDDANPAGSDETAKLQTIADPFWDGSDDVYRYLNVERARIRGRVKRPRAPPRPVFPKAVHEGRGGYISIDAGWREYRYPIELVQDGRFVIHFPAGHRLRDRAVHLAALEDMCRAEPTKWILERRDRGAASSAPRIR